MKSQSSRSYFLLGSTSKIHKNKLMTYTFVALVILAGVSAIAYWPTGPIISLIAVAVTVVLDYLLSRATKALGPVNTMSAVVFGLIVALFTL